MEMTGTNGACLMSCLSELDDPRQPSNGTLHDFQEILVIAIAAMLSDSDTVEDIAYWARKKEAWLRRFLVLKNGIPSEETFLRIFRVLDPKQFETAFRRWVSGVVGALSGTLAVDGKTVRGSGSGGETAIPEWLQALYLKGHRVTIDAMGCQKAIAAQIVAQKGDYLLAVKGNQPTLHAAIQKAFAKLSGEQPWHEPSERSHGRRVTQFAWVAPAEGVVNTRDWSACKTIGCIVSQRVVANKVAEAEWRYYISSSELSAADLALSTRAHWGIENRLHWVLDVSFGKDGSTLRKDNAPQNLSLLKKIVLNLIRLDTTDKTKASLRLKRKGAAWDDELRMNMLGLTPL